ncbi:hypothetical protein, partial [Pseudomonas brassicacearum]|uniref:hypothetical protein n=1 Tax=Pseudomonas brassicacearum TaxID=930166 RepID=UPI001C83E5DA
NCLRSVSTGLVSIRYFCGLDGTVLAGKPWTRLTVKAVKLPGNPAPDESVLEVVASGTLASTPVPEQTYKQTTCVRP